MPKLSELRETASVVSAASLKTEDVQFFDNGKVSMEALTTLISTFFQTKLKDIGFTVEVFSSESAYSGETFNRLVTARCSLGGIFIGTVSATIYLSKYSKPASFNVEFGCYHHEPIPSSELRAEIQASGYRLIKQYLSS
jgi:hypothetical protein